MRSGALGTRGYQALALVEQDASKRLASVRLRVPGGSACGVVGDLLVA